MITVALIPSYQPDERLVSLVRRLNALGMDEVVVDDGSGEVYSPLFDQARRDARVIRYANNRGKGYAIKCGLRFIRDHYADDTVVVTVDGDGQHDANDVARCAEAASAAGTAMVLGCRDFDDEVVPARSRLGNRATRVVYRLASGVSVSDTQTGLRAFPVALISFLVDVGGERYDYEMNVLMACPANGVEITEVPIRTIYEDGNACSHFRPLRDSALIYASILAFVASSFVSFLADYALFALLSSLLSPYGTQGVAIANVCARLASATLNFSINRTVVFRSQESVPRTALRYALVAGVVLAGNTCAMVLLVDVLGLNALVSKLIVEVTFFVVSWILQNRVVFKERSHA